MCFTQNLGVFVKRHLNENRNEIENVLPDENFSKKSLLHHLKGLFVCFELNLLHQTQTSI